MLIHNEIIFLTYSILTRHLDNKYITNIRDRMVVGFITTYAISAYHNYRCEFESRSGEVYSIQHYGIKFASDLRQIGGFLRCISVSSANKTDRNDITEILLS
jgi:hypothetical protein